MKTEIRILATLILTAMTALLNAQETKEVTPMVRVLYFHGINRCMTCNGMEKYTGELLQTEYARELQNGQITFQVFNFEDEANAGIVKKYGIESSALLLVTEKNGKEKVSNITDIGFSYAKNDPEKFKKEVSIKLNEKLR
jgi:hypothetical protein